MIRKIALWSGPGVCLYSEHFHRHWIQRYWPDATSSKIRDADLLLIPGGSGTEMRPHLENVLDEIKRSFDGGAKCLATCAGAYMLSRTIQYRHEDVCVKRVGFGILNARSVGPHIPNETRKTIQYFDGLSGKAHSVLGGTWTDVNGIVLARYHDRKPAILHQPYRNGHVIASAVHLESPDTCRHVSRKVAKILNFL